MRLSLFSRALIVYSVAAITCYGHASVEEDALEIAAKAECDLHREEVFVHTCKSWARNDFRPLLKSMFWPLWLSYRLAK